jgi:hypothetical protein
MTAVKKTTHTRKGERECATDRSMNERKQSAEHRGEQEQRRESERDGHTGDSRPAHTWDALHLLTHCALRSAGNSHMCSCRQLARNRAASAVELPRVQNAAHVDAFQAHCSIGDAQRCFKCILAWFNLKKKNSNEIFFFFFFFFSRVE